MNQDKIENDQSIIPNNGVGNPEPNNVTINNQLPVNDQSSTMSTSNEVLDVASVNGVENSNPTNGTFQQTEQYSQVETLNESAAQNNNVIIDSYNQNFNNNQTSNTNYNYSNGEGNNLNVNSNQQITNNVNSLNNKPKKGGIVIILIILVILVVGGCLWFLFGRNLLNGTSNNDNNQASTSSETDNGLNEKSVITKSDIDSYNLDIVVNWINTPLGIKYDIPDPGALYTYYDFDIGFTDIHGSSHVYDTLYKVYVEKSLKGATNLETLFESIMSEKFSDEYKYVYKDDDWLNQGVKVKRTQKVKIGDIDTVYFETDDFTSDSTIKTKISFYWIGYSFKYDDQYICVYAPHYITELETEDYANERFNKLKHTLQNIIFTIKPYNVDNDKFTGTKLTTFFSKHSCWYRGRDLDDSDSNMIYYSTDNRYLGTIRNEGRCYRINTDAVEWDGQIDSILDSVIHSKYLKYNDKTNQLEEYKNRFYYEYDWDKENINIEILEKDNLTIRGRSIIHYMIQYTQTYKSGTDSQYFSIYTLIEDGIPYFLKVDLDSDAYNEEYGGISWENMTDAQKKAYYDEIKAIGETIIVSLDRYDPNED